MINTIPAADWKPSQGLIRLSGAPAEPAGRHLHEMEGLLQHVAGIEAELHVELARSQAPP